MNKPLRALKTFPFLLLAFCFSVSVTNAQIGNGWVEYLPERKIHLVEAGYPTPKGMRIFDWVPKQEVGTPVCASYDFEASTNTETFRLVDKRSNRSEIRLFNEYEFGSRQFEGYVTFYAPLNDESLFQIWGSAKGATQLMVRGYAENNGSIGINYEGSNGQKVLSNCYGREIKVNIIHLQEDVGNRILVFLNNVKVADFPDNEKAINHDNKNYHKYGCYGTLKTDGAIAKWRNVKHFKDGKAAL
jgi:hypothetical protein